jgi:hypothetical protein
MTPLYDEFLTHRALAASATEELIVLIRSTGPGRYERMEAAWILGYRRCSQATPALIEMLRQGWYPDSVAAAEALAKIGEAAVIQHIEQVYEECKVACAGTHLHLDAKQRSVVLAALLRLRSEADLKQLLQQGDRLEGLLAGRELEMRRAIRRLRTLLSQGQGPLEAVRALCGSGEVPGRPVPFAVDAITGLPHEDSRFLVFCARHEGDRSEPTASADVGGLDAFPC